MQTAIFNDGENLRYAIRDLFANPEREQFNPGAHLFDRRGYLPKEADWSKFFQHIVGQINGGITPQARLVRAYWYVVDAVDAAPGNLPDAAANSAQLEKWRARHVARIRKFLTWAEKQERFKRLPDGPAGTSAILEELRRRKSVIEERFRGFAIIQRAIARNHQVEFRSSGAIRYDLFNCEFGEEKTTDVNLAVDMVMLQDEYDTAVIVSGDQDFVPAVHAVQALGKKVANVSFRQRSGKLLPSGARRLNKAVDWCVEVDYDTFRRLMFPKFQPPSGR